MDSSYGFGFFQFCLCIRRNVRAGTIKEIERPAVIADVIFLPAVIIGRRTT